MLVFVPRQEVSSVHVSPVPVLREDIIHVFPRSWASNLFTIFECSFSNSSAAGLHIFAHKAGWVRNVVLWVGAIGGVVSGIILFFISGLVGHSFSPGVNWGCPGTVSFNGNVVDASDDSDESTFSEVGAPTVSNNPIFLAVFNTEANHRNIMDNVLVSSGVLIDATGVVLKGLRYCNTAGNRASLIDFLDHVLFSRDLAILVNTIGQVLIGDEAGLVRVAVFADSKGGALVSVVMSSGSVDGAGLISHIGLVDIGKGIESSSSVASIIV